MKYTGIGLRFLKFFLALSLMVNFTCLPGPVAVEAATPAEIEAAIVKGVAWLAAQQKPDGSWSAGDYWDVGSAGLATLKLLDRAIETGKPFPDQTFAYYTNIQKGLDFIFSKAKVFDADKIYFNDSEINYQVGIAIMAIANTGTPTRVVNVPGSVVNGWTYKEVVQQAFNYLIAGQVVTGAPGEGGWDYDINAYNSDQSVSGMVCLGIAYAGKFGISFPTANKDLLKAWNAYIQCKNPGADYGGVGYRGPCDWVNTYKVGHFLFNKALVGDTPADPDEVLARQYLETYWNSGYPGWKSDPLDILACFTIMKGLEATNITKLNVGGNPNFDWFDDMSTALVIAQQVDGSWVPGLWLDEYLSTSMALLTLEKVTAGTCTITASAGPNGAISPPGIVLVNRGASKTFTITPSTGYHVADVLVDNVSVGAVTSYPFTNVTANHTIAASFAINTYTITASAGPNGAISPSGAVSVNYGASKTFTITPAANYHVADVLVDGASVGAVPRYTFSNVTANHTIAASFAIDTRTITATAWSHGTISPSGAVSVNYGANKTFTITPAANYHVASVRVDGVSKGSADTYTFSNVTANHTIVASFAPNPYTIYASAGANGAISPSGGVLVNRGASKTFTIKPAANYHVAGVRVDGASVGAVTRYTFSNVTANHTIAASFAIDTHTITATAGANGTISPAGAVKLNYGANKTFTITPAANYHVADVRVDGASVGAKTRYTFTNVTANHTIRASFAR